MDFVVSVPLVLPNAGHRLDLVGIPPMVTPRSLSVCVCVCVMYLVVEIIRFVGFN